MKDLSGRVAIVTGASRGIGPTIARALAVNGMRVVLTARSAEELEQARASVVEGGGEAVAVVADVASAEGRAAIVQGAVEAFGQVDVLVNNAGVLTRGRFDSLTAEEVTQILAVNLEAPMLLGRMVLPGMVERGRGHIVNISSLAGKVGTPFNAPYSASKAGLIAWTEALRVELHRTGVSASVVCPGFISGEGMFARSMEEGLKAGVLGTSTPAQVADAVVKAIRRDRGETIVNRGPLRPLLAMAELSPGFGEFVVKRSGVARRYEKLATHGMDT